ncbi:ABC-2 transporter permease [Flavobacterium cellulosilyticum]|uniref:DUF4175 family protein n=1 Tax=Flavobacterium cellulosilyticum TaxID=2541731 RepID=A0A4R5CMP9_9FLAO|nr:hypothetical protein [Flavobacterium cellulosilyticum]TDD99653.1 hypothetical protein E0F76_02710 [Flavobacterium cellulosilyticum]
MEKSNSIYLKLELFIKKFYTNELIRGIIFFIGLGLMYFLFTLFVEYFLWLKPKGRTILFWFFIGVEIFLFLRFILFPLFQLFQLKKGIEYNYAAKIIGNHFPEVSDKLTNFLQLSNDNNQSELLLASIEQKANSLQPIPFGNAINFNSNKKYLPFALLPIFVFAVFYISGNNTILSQSLNRVVHFKEKFSPPAPFQFVMLNKQLQTKQNQNFIIKIKTEGKIIPENVKLFIDNESYFMEKIKLDEFHFTIEKPSTNILFHVEANSISSSDYELSVIAVPSIANFEMYLHFPFYLNKKTEIIKGNGNAIIPEGTTVFWKIKTISTQSIIWKTINSNFYFTNKENTFSFSKTINQNTDYQILTSNSSVKNYEKLNFQLVVIKDQFPTITVSSTPDSVKVAKNYVLGQISDDYGLSKLQVVYYPINKPEISKRGTISIERESYDQFVFAFPSNLAVEQGVTYEYYFEVFDNDAIHNFKSSKSAVFSNRINTDSEKVDQDLQQQNNNINSLEKSLKNQDKQISDLEKIQKIGKEKDNLEFNDQQKINDFIKKQHQQDKMMKDFAEKMKDNLDKTKTANKDEFKQELQKRLENVDKDLEKNKKLLEELKELSDKIKQEDLMEKMDQFKQTAKNQTKSLEQLVELTKKYYIQKKGEQIKDKINKLSEKQDLLPNKEQDNKLDRQEDINAAFDKIQDELKDLDKENKELKKPLDIGADKEQEKSIDDDLKKATDELQKDNKVAAKPKQKSAAKKMKQMSQKMEQSMEQDSKEQLEEDVAMLRQVLDNLLAFSFSQEDLMAKFKSIKVGSPSFNKNLKSQQDLKLQFKHIDDSLFAMSLRNPKIGEDITKEIGNAQYNLDKSTETFVDAQLTKGISHQQYVISSANKMGNLLADILNNMQMSLSSMGSGKPKPGQGEGMQLSDIIKKQEGLGEKMKKGMEKGNKPGEDKDGELGKKPNSSGSKGESGENGEDGEGNAKDIMEIYKEQQQLRESLQNELNKQGIGGSGQSAIYQMKELEKQLLNKGFKNETLQRILNIKQELLKLNTAIQQQGQESKRQSQTNKNEFNNQSNVLPTALRDYLNSIELLNRQSLPLHSNFNQKVQYYFKNK